MDKLMNEFQRLVELEAEKLTKTEDSYKEKYQWLEHQLKELIAEAEVLKEDVDRNNLTVSSIEAEGYLRCALNIKALIDNT